MAVAGKIPCHGRDYGRVFQKNSSARAHRLKWIERHLEVAGVGGPNQAQVFVPFVVADSGELVSNQAHIGVQDALPWRQWLVCLGIL